MKAIEEKYVKPEAGFKNYTNDWFNMPDEPWNQY